MTHKPSGVFHMEMAMFYMALAMFSGGIALQQITLCLFALVQVLAGMVYGLRPRTLLVPERRAGALFLLVTSLCAIPAYRLYPSSDPIRIHWAIGAFWVVAPALAARADWRTLHRIMLSLSVPGLLYSVFWLSRPAEVEWAMTAGFEHYPRAFGFLSNPITYAEGLVVLAGWTTARLTQSETVRRERLWLVAHLVLSVVIVLGSRVRVGLLGFVVLFLLNALFSKRFRKAGLALSVLVPLLFLLSTLLFGFNTASLRERITLARSSIALFAESPVYGIGPNKFNHQVGDLGVLPQHPHNTVLGMLTEFGVVGLAFYLIFMVSLARNLLLIWRRRHAEGAPPPWLAYALLFSFISFHLFGLFDYNYADTELLILHALHWGVIANLAGQARVAGTTVSGGTP